MNARSIAPNILWICTDQQRYDTVAALGNPHIHTPNLDRLVAEGVAFTHAHAQCPICTPSRASFLTGMYPCTVHGCTNGNDYWAEAAPLVTKLLKDAGYDCGLSGKLHLSAAQGRIERRPRDDGYRVFHWSHHPRDDWGEGHAYADWLRAQGHDPAQMYKDRESRLAIPPELHQTSWCADCAIEFMSEDREGPWLMSVNTFDPHGPFDPPQEYLDRYDPDSLAGPLFRESDFAAQAKLKGVDFQTPCRRPEEFNGKWHQAAYYAMVELIDHNVGRMLAALERTGQRENTVVIFTSDHGECLGDHGLLLKGCRFYEGLIRVPLIISCPGRFKKGLRSRALVSLPDLAPTLLELAGLEIPERVQAESLLGILTGDADPSHHRDYVRAEYYHVMDPNTHYDKPPTAEAHKLEGSYATMIRDRRHKLVVYHGHPVGELFDMQKDPGEFNNLWDDPASADVRFELMKKSFDDLAFAVDIGPKQVARF